MILGGFLVDGNINRNFNAVFHSQPTACGGGIQTIGGSLRHRTWWKEGLGYRHSPGNFLDNFDDLDLTVPEEKALPLPWAIW